MKFLVDAQLPPGPARWLKNEGHEAQHVEELGLHQAEDLEIWDHTLKLGLGDYHKRRGLC